MSFRSIRMERKIFYSVLCFLLGALFDKCVGSEVKLTATPGTITNGLTETLKLRCSLQDTTNASGLIVGRQVSITAYDIEHVNSIIISRVNPDETVTSLAKIIMSENAKVVGDLEIVTVVGNLTSSNPADPEYLELTWRSPGGEQSGSYICEVNGLDLEGHGVMLQKSMAVNSADPEVRDLVKEFNSLKASFTSQYQDLAEENNDLKATVDVLTSQIQDLDKENDDLKATVDGLTSEIQDLARESNELKAILLQLTKLHTLRQVSFTAVVQIIGLSYLEQQQPPKNALYPSPLKHHI